MKAIVVHADAEQPRLVWQDAPEPEMGAGEVLVRVRASAVNRADLLQARGGYAPPSGASPILGLEMAGDVLAVGDGVAGWQPGDRVCALLPGGGYAELAVVPQQMLLRLPDGWTYAQGAAVPEAWYTAFVNLFLEGDLQAGERTLIHAGASGVGTAAIQLARAAGATVYATAGTAEKTAQCQMLGAVLAVNYRQEDFGQVIQQATAGAGVDLILDPVGAAYLARNLALLRPQGRLVSIGLLSGGRAELDMGLLLGKRLRLIGSTLRNRSLAEKIAITEQFRERFWPLLAAGALVPVIDCAFPMPEAQAAHAYVRQNRNTGKVILTVTDGVGEN
ncbi:MAG: NAD(P)H-quinone oxidoreductase [Candidatus Promineifilaceae bacterium]